jgi:small conductance mechanosensitive channel
VHTIPYSAIDSVTNLTKEFSFAVFDIGVSYRESVDQVMDVLRQLGEEMRRDPAYRRMILEPLDVMGVDAFADSAVIIRARFKTRPLRQFEVRREFNRRIKKRFDELGIEIPFPHMSVYFGEASAPFALSLNATDRDTVKSLLRDVLRESRPETEGGTPTADATPPRS